MKRKILLAALTGSSLLLSDAASAQWLDPTLDSQRWSNLRKHQQRQREKALQQQRQSRPGVESGKPLTLAERQAAWSRNKAEYRRRLLRDGQASADRWLDGIARANR